MQIINVEQGSEEWHALRKGKIKGSNVYNVLATSEATKDQIVAILDEHNIDYPKTTPRNGGDPKPKGTKEELAQFLTDDMRAELMRRADKKVEFYQLIADRIALDFNLEYDENDEVIQNGGTMMDRGTRLEDDAAQLFYERTGIELTVAGFCVRDDNENIANSPDRLIKKGSVYPGAVEIKCLKTAKHLQALLEQKIPEDYVSQAVQYFVVNDELDKLYFVFYDPRIPYTCKMHWIEVTRKDYERKIARHLKYETILLEEVDKIVEELVF